MNEIIIGSDHNGFQLKESLIKFLKSSNISVYDRGCYTADECDYNSIGTDVSLMVTPCTNTEGILICGSGIGMSIIANKIRSSRAALCSSPEDAISSREICNSNILVLAANKLSEQEAIVIVAAWLNIGLN